MNVIVRQPRNVDEFLRWDGDGSDAKYEFVDGRPVMLPTGTADHSQIVMNLAFALRNRLDRQTWRVEAGQFGIRMGEIYRIPDVMVRPRHGSGGPLASAYATFIAEVLSPGSEKEDLRRKPREYLAVPELRDYVVIVQGEAVAWLWSRGADGLFPAESIDIRGLSAELPISGLGLTIPLAEIYFGTDVADV